MNTVILNTAAGAVFRAARGGLGGRRLQAVIIGVVVLASTAASTLALGMLADAHSPFDHAFAAQHGADVTVTVDTSLATRARLASAAMVAGVTAVAGPYAVNTVTANVTTPGFSGSTAVPLQVVGRTSPGGAVDDLSLDAGRWARTDGEIVLSRNAPGQIGSVVTIGSRKLTVVGVADSVTNTADAWVRPAELTAIAGTDRAQLLYRFAAAGTSAQVAADIAQVKTALPAGAMLGTVSYLDVRQSEQSSVAPWVPFIVAFGVIALVISVLIVVNVVGGAVVAGTTRIGVLKSIGFTPTQVVAAYIVLAGVPAVIGAVAGVICGNLLAVPLLRRNAEVYQVGALGVPFWVDATVPLAVLVLTVAAAAGPALRAGRMSPVQAIATGRAPRPAHGYIAQRALARLTRVPRPVTLGLAAPSARPGRTLITVVAVLFGATAVTFGVGLSTTLDRVYKDIAHGESMPVQVSALPSGVTNGGHAGAAGPRGGPGKHEKVKVIVGLGQHLTTAQQRVVTAALAAQPGTLHYVSVALDQLSLPGLAAAGGNGGVRATAYSDPALTGIALISGRWYSAVPGAREADVNTLFLTDTGTKVGGTYPIVYGNRTVTVTIVGEVFQPGNDVDLFTSPQTLAAIDPAANGPAQYSVGLKPGVSAQAYANTLNAVLGDGYDVGASSGGGAVLLAVVTLVAMLTLLIMAVAGLGVLNTVALQIRERAHDIGVFKALGMTPGQTLAMITCSVAITGLVAGIIAVPAGILLHHGVIPAMASAANSGYPPSVISVYSPVELVLLALAGLVIAVAGAVGPALWAAKARTAFALRTE
jgi:putative ABC transport system permease protein